MNDVDTPKRAFDLQYWHEHETHDELKLLPVSPLLGEKEKSGVNVALFPIASQFFVYVEGKAMEVQVGKITHYYNRISVAVLELSGELEVGEMIHILGRITDFDQRVASMEIEHHKIQSARPGTEVALKVIEYVRKGDVVFKVEEDV